MGARDTSIEAYHDAKVKGLIRQNEMSVIEVAHEHWRDEGHTTKELMRLVAGRIGRDDWDVIQDFQKVIKPLKAKGVLEELDKRPCAITGRKAYPVRLTYQMPVKIDHSESERKILRDAVKKQAEEIVRLKKINDNLKDELRRLKNGELF